MANGFLLHSLPFAATDFSTPEMGTSSVFLANDFMGMVYRNSDSISSLGARLDLGTAKVVDTIALLRVITLGAAASVVVFAGDDPTFATYGFSADISPAAGELAMAGGYYNLVGAFSPVGPYRYWYVQVWGQAGVITAELARVVIGNRVQPSRNFSFGVARGVEDLGEVDHSPRGATLRRRARKLRALGLSWQFISQAEAEGFALPLLEEVGNTEYLLACLDPAAHVQRTRRMYFGNLKGDLSLTWRAHDLFEKRLQMQSVI